MKINRRPSSARLNQYAWRTALWPGLAALLLVGAVIPECATATGATVGMPKQWTVFICGDSAAEPSTLTQIPETLKCAEQDVAAHEVELRRHQIDFRTITGTSDARDEAWAFAELEAPEAGTVTVHAAADWWMAWYVNGKPVFDTLETGNRGKPIALDAFTFDLPLRKGKNVLAVRVLSGGGGWRLLCATDSDIPKRQQNVLLQSDLAREYVASPCDGPDWPPALPAVDETRGAVIRVPLENGQTFKQGRYLWQAPHDRISFYLKGNGSQSRLRVQVTATIDGKSETISSKPVTLDFTDWKRVTLDYATDFGPAALARRMHGRNIRWFKLLCRAKTDRPFFFDDLRYINSDISRPFEIRHLLNGMHVQHENAPTSFPLLIHSDKPRDIAFTWKIVRSDGAHTFTGSEKISTEGGEQQITLSGRALPRGRYSLLVTGRTERGDAFSKGAYFLVCPDRHVERWMGDHEGGAYLYNENELEDLRRGGYRVLRDAGSALAPVCRGATDRIPFADAYLKHRLDMGFSVIGSMMRTGVENFDLDRARRLKEELNLQVDDFKTFHANYPAADKQLLAKNIETAVRHFGDRVIYWEFGNEFDRVAFPEATAGKFCWWGDGRDYAEDLKYFHRGAKRGNAAAQVVSTGITCNLHLPGRNAFVDDMLDAGAARYFDVFGLHGYGGLANLQRVLDKLEERGIEKPFVNTERGYRGSNLHSMKTAVKEILFHKYRNAIAFISFINRRRQYAGPRASGRDASWDNFYTRHYDGSPTKLWAAFSTASFVLDGARGMEKIENELYSGYRFVSKEGHGLVLYKDGPSLDLPCITAGTARKLDIVGNEVPIAGRDFAVEVTDIPVYVLSTAPIEIRAETRAGELTFEVVDRAVGLQLTMPETAETPESFRMHAAPAGWQFGESKSTDPRSTFFPATKLSPCYEGEFSVSAGTEENTAALTARKTVLPQSHLASSIRIDGKLDEWDAAAWLSLKRGSQVGRGANVWKGMTDTNSYFGDTFRDDNLSGAVAFTLADDDVCLAVRVTDDELNLSQAGRGAPLKGDFVTVEFVSSQADLHNVRVHPVRNGQCRIRTRRRDRDQIEARWTRLGESEYGYEIRLPRTLFKERHGRLITLNVTLADADRHVGYVNEPYIEMSAGEAGKVSRGMLPLFLLQAQERTKNGGD